MTATVVPVKSWQLWGLLLAVISLQAAAIEFNVYEPCGGLQTTSVSVPQCRRELAAAALARQRQQTVGVAAVPQQLPVDMRLPCEDRGIECHKVSMRCPVLAPQQTPLEGKPRASAANMVEIDSRHFSYIMLIRRGLAHLSVIGWPLLAAWLGIAVVAACVIVRIRTAVLLATSDIQCNMYVANPTAGHNN